MKHHKKYLFILISLTVAVILFLVAALFYRVVRTDNQAIEISRIPNISNTCYVTTYNINTNSPKNMTEKISLGIILLFRGAVFYRVYKSNDHTLVATTEWDFFQAAELIDEYDPRWLENNITLIYPTVGGDKWLHADEC